MKHISDYQVGDDLTLPGSDVECVVKAIRHDSDGTIVMTLMYKFAVGTYEIEVVE
jgi:hypothetical protein